MSELAIETAGLEFDDAVGGKGDIVQSECNTDRQDLFLVFLPLHQPACLPITAKTSCQGHQRAAMCTNAASSSWLKVSQQY